MDKAYTPALPMLFVQPGGSPRYERTGANEAVSILMRTKNRPIMLPRALRSVLSQGFRDWHLFIVNDGGDAAAVERLLAEHTDALDGRSTVIHHATACGMEAASNSGLEAARGEYVVIHDDDDTWDPAFLERTVHFLSTPANAGYIGVVTNCRIVWERIDRDAIIEEEQVPFPRIGPNIEFSRVLAANLFPPISLLLRREVLQRSGAFNADMPVLGDWEFNLRALALGDFGFIPDVLAYYHQRRDPTDTVYGNSVIAGAEDHRRYEVLLRNNIIRIALRDNPALIGVVQPMLHGLGEQTDTISQLNDSLNEVRIRLDRIEEHLAVIHEVSRWQGRILSPVQRSWMALLPLRRGVARLFGRSLS